MQEKELLKILSIPFSFSPNCRSGLSSYIPGGKCNCSRCRKSRGEDVTIETEKLAKKQAENIDLLNKK